MTQAFDMMNPIGGVQEFPGKAVFLPTDISGLLIWLDAILETGETNGVGVTQWVDQSGRSSPNHVGQLTSGSRPLYIASYAGFGGAPALQFDGTDDFMTNASVDGSGADLTCFAVIDRDATAGTENVLSMEGTTDWAWRNIQASTQFSLNDGSERGFGSAQATPGIYRLEKDSTNTLCRAFWNGAQSGTDQTHTPKSWAGELIIGDVWTKSNSQCFTGHMGAILVYNTILPDAQCTQVEVYLAGRYGITLS